MQYAIEQGLKRGVPRLTKRSSGSRIRLLSCNKGSDSGTRHRRTLRKRNAVPASASDECGCRQGSFAVLKETMDRSGVVQDKKRKIILTVKGDIHDIGKNIVKVLLENYGFDVIDLGKDVEPERIVETAKSEQVRLVGLSALMTTTVVNMEETIRLLRKEKPDCQVMVGGAVLNQEYADMIGADFYGRTLCSPFTLLSDCLTHPARSIMINKIDKKRRLKDTMRRHSKSCRLIGE